MKIYTTNGKEPLSDVMNLSNTSNIFLRRSNAFRRGGCSVPHEHFSKHTQRNPSRIRPGKPTRKAVIVKVAECEEQCERFDEHSRIESQTCRGEARILSADLSITLKKTVFCEGSDQEETTDLQRSFHRMSLGTSMTCRKTVFSENGDNNLDLSNCHQNTALSQCNCPVTPTSDVSRTMSFLSVGITQKDRRSTICPIGIRLKSRRRNVVFFVQQRERKMVECPGCGCNLTVDVSSSCSSGYFSGDSEHSFDSRGSSYLRVGGTMNATNDDVFYDSSDVSDSDSEKTSTALRKAFSCGEMTSVIHNSSKETEIW